MSFRLFVYYCAIAGGWAGLIGWGLGNVLSTRGGPNPNYFDSILRTSLVAMFLGVSVAFGLSFLDASFNLTLSRFGGVFMRVATAVIVGLFGGLFGGFIGGTLYYFTQAIEILRPVSYVLGWTIVGFLIGLSIGFFEVLSSLVTQKDVGSAFKKIVKCLIGGTVGGILGGIMALGLKFGAEKIASLGSGNIDVEKLWCPIASGFIAIGACIGLLVGLAQLIMKEAWIKVEAGFRPGREMFLSREKTTIGRAEGSDIALFGDAGVEKNHANIVKENGRYYLEDLQSPGGTYLNDQKVQGKAPLKAGDLIRVGKSVLLFNERAKRKE